MALQHYNKQSRSMLCRIVERNHIQESYSLYDDGLFDYNFLPYCFRDIGFQPSPLLNFLRPRMI